MSLRLIVSSNLNISFAVRSYSDAHFAKIECRENRLRIFKILAVQQRHFGLRFGLEDRICRFWISKILIAYSYAHNENIAKSESEKCEQDKSDPELLPKAPNQIMDCLRHFNHLQVLVKIRGILRIYFKVLPKLKKKRKKDNPILIHNYSTNSCIMQEIQDLKDNT